MELKKEKDNYKNGNDGKKMSKEMVMEKLNIIMEIFMMVNGKIKSKVMKMKKSLFKTLINLKKKNILFYIRIINIMEKVKFIWKMEVN